MKQTFGLEFEYASKINQSQTAAILMAALKEQFTITTPNKVLLAKHAVDNQRFGYHEHDVAKWGVEYDSSIVVDSKYKHQIEIISPILTQNDFPVVKLILDKVKSGAKVNPSCGLHCHIGVTQQEHAAKCAMLWYISEPIIVNVFPLARSYNQYCRRLTETPLELSTIGETDRHDMLNTQSWRIRKTVEFRGHSGTLNYQKAKKWVLFCLSFVRLAYDMSTDNMKQYLDGPYRHTVFNIFDALDIQNSKTQRYFMYRMQHFEKAKKKRILRETAVQAQNRRSGLRNNDHRLQRP